MTATLEILALCINETPRKSIIRRLKWTGGGTGTLLKRLEKRELIKKTKYGFYQTTQKGIEYIKSKIYEKSTEKANEKIRDISIILGLQIEKRNNKKRSLPFLASEIQNIEEITKEVYFMYIESVDNDHDNPEFIRTMWKTHRQMICKEHSFNFEEAFEKNAQVMKQLNKEYVFNTIHTNIYSPIEKIRQELTLNQINKTQKESNTKELDNIINGLNEAEKIKLKEIWPEKFENNTQTN